MSNKNLIFNPSSSNIKNTNEFNEYYQSITNLSIEDSISLVHDDTFTHNAHNNTNDDLNNTNNTVEYSRDDVPRGSIEQLRNNDFNVLIEQEYKIKDDELGNDYFNNDNFENEDNSKCMRPESR